MAGTVFLASNRNGLARAECTENGRWNVQLMMQGQDVGCLAASPHRAGTVYAGTQGSGVLRSDDGGRTWRASGMAEKVVKSLEVSPHDPETIYAGTNPAYLYVSRDGGGTWQELDGFRRIPWRGWWFSPAEKPWTAYVQSISVSPDDPQVILAGIEFGAVVRSRDGGLTWSGHRRGALRDCHSLQFHPTNGSWAYEAGGTGGGASYSRDGGLSWHKAKEGLARHYGVACAADPGRPEVWYVSTAPSPARAYGHKAEAYLYRSSGGAGWQPIGWEPAPMKHMPIVLAAVPGLPGQLYAGLTNGDVWHTADYGDTWHRLPLNLKGIWRNAFIVLPGV